ncbi:hypothetical protein [Bifidobacterium coryneforme]|uniref:hypothetical protein n=1 Tax=Bifidobacterium coryneforme TaxID=1687 RepID=UPI0005959FE3|nr:hypothetical protein [Bifidobacterium indicum]
MGVEVGLAGVFREEPAVLRAGDADPPVWVALVPIVEVDLGEEVREEGEKLGGIWDSAADGAACLRCDRP